MDKYQHHLHETVSIGVVEEEERLVADQQINKLKKYFKKTKKKRDKLDCIKTAQFCA